MVWSGAQRNGEIESGRVRGKDRRCQTGQEGMDIKY